MNATGKLSLDKSAVPSILNHGTAILVIEDNPKDTFLLKKAFSRPGIRVPIIFVKDGQEAIDYLLGEPPFEDRNTNPWPALVVLDLALPKVDGFEVLAWMRGHLATSLIPVVVCSAVAQRHDIQRAFAMGAEFLQKTSDMVQHAESLYQLAQKYGLTEPKPAAPGNGEPRASRPSQD